MLPGPSLKSASKEELVGELQAAPISPPSNPSRQAEGCAARDRGPISVRTAKDVLVISIDSALCGIDASQSLATKTKRKGHTV